MSTSTTNSIPSIDLEPRLQARYELLVRQHSAPEDALAAGLHALPDGGTTFAAVQGCWRFLRNLKVTLKRLTQPLQEHVRQQLAARSPNVETNTYVLIAHDWSWIDFNGHISKLDRTINSTEKAMGYELLNAFATCPTTGAPIGPVNLDLRSAEGVITSRHEAMQPLSEGHQEALLTQVEYVEGLNLGATCVHIVDREGDSVANYRAFAETKRLCLIRGKGSHLVDFKGETLKLSDLPSRLTFAYSREVLYHGRAAQQYVAEARVTLTRPYIRTRNGVSEEIPGPPVTLRMVISQVRDAEGRLLATWYLYTNVPDSVPAETIALWYYYRWRIECFHKLLKSGGWHMEEWQQETASAVAKRLAVVSMAAALIWQIQYSEAPEVETLRRELIALSGRQMSRRQPVTAPALLVGLWALLSAIELLERYTPDELRALALLAGHAVRRE